MALGAAIFIDHYLTLALRHTFHRLGPPAARCGTFPSGGCDRIIVFYGLIAYLIWREVSGTKRAAIWSAGVVAALAFSEGYSRGYLTLHWFTDILSGLIYGSLILAVFIVTIRVVVGPGAEEMDGRAARPCRLRCPASKRRHCSDRARHQPRSPRRGAPRGRRPARGRTSGARGRPVQPREVCAVLWPPPATVSLSRGPRSLRPGRAAGSERDFIVLPSARRPRLLVPSGRRASAAAVRRYGEPGSVRAWAGSRALALALAGRRGPAGLGGRLRVRVSRPGHRHHRGVSAFRPRP